MKYKLVDAIEFDKYAVKSYNAIFGTEIVPTDIREVNQLPKCDFLTFGFPCQDISVSGQGKGIAKGTRSGLLFEVERLLENAKYKPKFLLMENVKNLVGIKHKADFDKWLEKLNQLGYENYYQVLNSKDYGIPQNRERVFCLSVREDVDDAHWFPQFQFPKKQELKLTTMDLIEEQVDNKFYLRDVVLEKIKRAKTNKFVNKKADFDGNIFDICYPPSSQEFVRTGFSDKCPTLAARDYKDPKCVQVGNVSSEKYDKMHESSRRVYSIKGIVPTLSCCGGGNREVKILDDTYSNRKCREYTNIPPTLRANRIFKVSIATNDKMTRIKRKKSKVIRKLTPKEYWRFQGFDDESFHKAEKVNSNTQLYKQAGNSITVDVLVAIYEQIQKHFVGEFEDGIEVVTLFSGIGAFEKALENL